MTTRYRLPADSREARTEAKSRTTDFSTTPATPLAPGSMPPCPGSITTTGRGSSVAGTEEATADGAGSVRSRSEAEALTADAKLCRSVRTSSIVNRDGSPPAMEVTSA